MKRVFVFAILFTMLIPRVNAQEELNLDSKSAILIDQASGKVLYEKDAHEQLPMASMTKIMSLLLIMERINSGELSYTDKVLISKTASDMGGSQVFLQEGEEYKVEDLIKCIAVSSANDAVVAMAEKIAGTVDAFVGKMNDKASSLGLKNTHFVNPHGLDSENHYSTASDMAVMARELLKYEDILKFTSIYEDYLTKPDGSQVWLVNTNRLVRFYEGVDGLKTGFTSEAGFCLTATAKKNDLRLISVVMNATTSDNRSKDTTSLLSYGFNSYKNNIIYEKNKKLGDVEVLNGKKERVSVYLREDATELLKVGEKAQDYSFNLKIDKIKAPKKAGDVVGEVEIMDNESKIVKRIDAIIKEDLKKATFIDYIKSNFKVISSGI